MANEALYEDDIDSLTDDDHEAVPESYQDAYGEDQTLDELNAAPAESEWQEAPQDAYDTQTAGANEPHAQPLDPLDQLPMALTLRCGSLNLTLGDLRRMAAGTTLPVNGITPGFATLCHGERVVAEGELVDIDGRLGLQITRMASPV
ncbi:FliM/FliN family flagellar motor switch protein [Pseudomonas sp. F3-2]|uniref:FliM/FliN family flagellar motor switch protein n=1 Tax=Pseudomonas sp. F3-2 TaxID=3141539 RepID=UPI00315D5ED6